MNSTNQFKRAVVATFTYQQTHGRPQSWIIRFSKVLRKGFSDAGSVRRPVLSRQSKTSACKKVSVESFSALFCRQKEVFRRFFKFQSIHSTRSSAEEEKLHIESTLVLNNGIEIPRFGLGVYKSSPGTETKQAVKWAIERGYPMIDTAARYANEHDVGQVLKKVDVSRKSLFIVTKVWDDMHGYENTIQSLKNSLEKLGIAYVDLFLIHSPVGGKIVDTWKAMIHLMEQGLTRSIGVSNFGVHHLIALGKYSKIVPSVNQIEVHPFNQERAVMQYCKDNGIHIMAYSPLTRGLKLNHPVVQYIAKKHHKTAANVLIRWSLQKNLICIPKSVKERHIKENNNVFDFQLDDNDMNFLDLLEENFRTGRDRLKEIWMA